MEMELPPGYRGYGEDNSIPHPYTTKRQLEVNEIAEQSADRFERQKATMSFELPGKYLPKNQRRTAEPAPVTPQAPARKQTEDQAFAKVEENTGEAA